MRAEVELQARGHQEDHPSVGAGIRRRLFGKRHIFHWDLGKEMLSGSTAAGFKTRGQELLFSSV